MGDVVQIGFRTIKPNQIKTAVWECGCGNQLWFLAQDGRCVCVACRGESTVIQVSLKEQSK